MLQLAQRMLRLTSREYSPAAQAIIMPGSTHSMHVHDSIPNEGESYAPWVQDRCALPTSRTGLLMLASAARRRVMVVLSVCYTIPWCKRWLPIQHCVDLMRSKTAGRSALLTCFT